MNVVPYLMFVTMICQSTQAERYSIKFKTASNSSFSCCMLIWFQTLQGFPEYMLQIDDTEAKSGQMMVYYTHFLHPYIYQDSLKPSFTSLIRLHGFV